ncbi:MAG TPA: methyltransferase domain-containing protein [Bryobacteraceae bacterium]|nr:methyltransferase domain-containing protein [Bryobacteraceae bacterium]
MRDWDQHYRNPENIQTEPVPLLVRAVAGLAPGAALDLACGPGRNALFLARHGWSVTALDASTVAIAALRAQGAAEQITVDARVADLEHPSFLIRPDAWDLICDFFYLHRDLFPAIRQGIRPGGLFVATIHLFDDSRPGNPNFLLHSGELRSLFSGWTLLHYAEVGQPEHRRRAAELIARREK